MTKVRYTKTFTETQRNVVQDGQWTVVRVSDTDIDDQINAWAHVNKHVIESIFASVEHASIVSQDPNTYFTRVRYIVTYVDQATYQSQNEGMDLRKLATPASLPGLKPAKAVQQPAAGTAPNIRMEHPVARDIPVATPAVQVSEDVEEVENAEEASPWQEEGASPQEAKKEMEGLVADLNTAIQTKKLPDSRRKPIPPKTAITNPSAPIQISKEVLADAKSPGSTPPPQQVLEALPTRMIRVPRSSNRT